MVTFFWGKTRSARRALQKYEKQVRGRKVVVRDGGGGPWATCCTSPRTTGPFRCCKLFGKLPTWPQKNKMSRVYRLFFGGSDRANRQVSKGRGKVLKRGTHGYGVVRGGAVSGTQEP